jgi:cytidylate kinase
MKRAELIDRYFSERRQVDVHFGGYPFVTVSRQAGAGGQTLGKALLQAMEPQRYTDMYRGWMLFDRQLCEDVAAEEDLSASLKALLSEEYHSEVTDFIHQILHHGSPQTAVYRRLFEFQRALAAVGKVILIGRGAGMVSRDMRAGIRLRLTAPREQREAALAAQMDLAPEEARKLITRYDRERAHFIRDMFNAEIDDPSLYDRMWDTSQTTMEAIADEVLVMIKAKAKEVGRD